MTKTTLFVVVAALLMTNATTAYAQGAVAPTSPAPAAVPGAPPAASVLNGPVIAGVCVLSPEAVLASSKVGVAVATRLQQLSQAAQSEVAADRSALETEAKALQTPAKGVAPAQLEQRRAKLNDRVKALQDKITGINRELEYTRGRQYAIISADAQPLVVAAYGAHGCGLLFRRDSLLGGNPANDLTSEVVRELDAKVTTLTFDRLPAPPPQIGGTNR